MPFLECLSAPLQTRQHHRNFSKAALLDPLKSGYQSILAMLAEDQSRQGAQKVNHKYGAPRRTCRTCDCRFHRVDQEIPGKNE